MDRIATIVPINYIEIVEEFGERVPYLAGTRLTVAEIGNMYVYQDSSVDWIVENFDVKGISAAKVHAAISYYLDHQAELDDYLHRQSEAARAQADADLSDVIARMKARLKPE